MKNLIRKYAAFGLALLLALIATPAAAQTPPAKIGVVVMHGKGGSPTRLVATLASALENRGHLVANQEMPWSGRRNYDVNLATAEQEVESTLARLRNQGATHLFVAGHSQGGMFALYFAARHTLAGIVAIAPGGSVGNAVFREKLGASVAKAKRLVTDGKGDEKADFIDYEGAKGTFPVFATPADYLSWFDPDSAWGNNLGVVSQVQAGVPVLFIAPRRDYPGLLKIKQTMFDALPRHALTRLYEPDSNHVEAPTAALDEIANWLTEVAAQTPALR